VKNILVQKLSDLPIHKKLVTIILLTLWLALSLASVSLILYDYTDSKKSLESELEVLASVIADRSSAAVSFRDKKAARGNLESLQAKTSINQACLYFLTGELFVSYKNVPGSKCSGLLINSSDNIFYKSNYLYIQQKIYLNRKPIAVLIIQTGLEPIYERLWQFSSMALLILIMSGFLAYLLTLRLQHQITEPLIFLNNTATNVTHFKDYSLRAEKLHNDEVGDLVDSFNSMLNTIQHNEIQLREAMFELEEKNDESEAKVLTTEEKHQAMKEFFAGVSHDLKQPLNAMSLFIDAMKLAPTATMKLDVLNKLEQSLVNLNQLFTDLLDKSKLEHGFSKVKKQYISLGSIFSNISSEFGVLATDKNIRFSVHGSNNDVFTDPLILERILRNLISNAIRYTKSGGVILAARKRRDQIWIEVWDSGQGIAADKLDDVFEAHVQLDNPDHDPAKGFGLGLSIVNKMIDSLAIELEVKSEVGRGTLMRLKIEENAVPQLKNLTSHKLSNISENINDPLQGLIALLIDDDESVLESTDIILKSWGVDTLIACDYDEALQLAEQGNYKIDFILADYDLGNNQYGSDLIKQIRDKSKTHIPAVIISGETDVVLSSLENDGFDVLKKPLKAARLRAMVNHCLYAE
jgi:two-component system, sensor histidine kinase